MTTLKWDSPVRQELIKKLENFCKLDPKTGCFNWTRSLASGYGKIWFGGSKDMAHRAAYFLGHGALPPKKIVCHKCNNKLCCNPHHMYAGTQSDNTKDMIKDGCFPHIGEKHYQAVFTEDMVREARRLYKIKKNCAAVARELGVERRTLSNVIHGKTWKHVA